MACQHKDRRNTEHTEDLVAADEGLLLVADEALSVSHATQPRHPAGHSFAVQM